MAGGRWQRVERIYLEAANCPPSQREAFVSRECEGDAELRAEVERLLSGEARLGSFLEAGAVPRQVREPLVAGTRIGPYDILSLLGAGGMGEVYEARDTRLNRTVAIKVLPPYSAPDAERRKRLIREARAASTLNHPGIVTIYDVLSEGEHHAIVMECVKGRTLSQIAGGSPLSVDQLVDYGIQIAGALSAAHAAGVVHRDIKPGNIMITSSGVKVLDFGLARLHSGSGGETATLTVPGSVAGTLAYMSPEQARGEKLDGRSDLFSFGIVLYELAAGILPFGGNTAAIVFDQILNRAAVPPSRHNPGVPAELDRIILKLLEKDRDTRYQDANDVLDDLTSLQRSYLRNSSIAANTHKKAKAIIAVAATLAVAGLAYSGWHALQSRKSAPALSGATFTQLTSAPGEELTPSFSPDGKTIAYASSTSGDWDIYLLRIGGKNPIDLTADCKQADTEPAFSPDGEHIAFRSARDGGGIFLMGATGESVRRITDFGYSPSWSPEGKALAFVTETVGNPTGRGSSSRLWTVDLSTSEKKQITQTDAVQPRWSPHGHRIAYAGTEGGRRDIWTIPAQGGDPVSVTRDNDVDWSPSWSPDGDYLYFASDRGGRMNLWRLPIDEKTGKVLGGAEPVTTPSPYSGHVSLSPDGQRLAYVQWVKSNHMEKVAFDPVAEKVTGTPTSISQGSRPAYFPDPSPDGQWLTFCSFERPEDIFVIRTDGSSLRNLTDDDFVDRFPRWSPDGNWIQFMSDRTGKYQIWMIHPDGSGLRQVTYEPDGMIAGGVWSSDGTRIAYNRNGDVPKVVDVRKTWPDQTPQPLAPYEGRQFWAYSWSPDGNFLAGSGGPGQIVYSFNDHTYTRAASAEHYPVWLRDSRRMLIRSGDLFEVFDITTQKRHGFFQQPAWGRFSISPDNRTLYYSVNTSEADIWLMTFKK